MERPKRRSLLRALTVLAGVLTTPDTWGQPPGGGPASDFVLRPGIVVRADRSEAYLMRPEGGIEAVDVDLGRTLWTTEAASRPLAVRGRLLLAQTESSGRSAAVGLALLDVTSGEIRREAEVDLPETVWTGIDDGLGAAFAIEAWGDADALLVAWAGREQAVGGAAVARPPAHEAGGAARLETASGRVQALPAGAVTPPPRPTFLVPPQDRLAPVPGRQFLSVDGRHVLASERVADDRVWTKYRWTLYDRASGERLGEIASRASMAELFVAGTSVVHLAAPFERRLEDGSVDGAPLRLRAVDLASGAELWWRPVRDTRYPGPFPP